MSVEAFNRLVKMAARAFYDDITTKGENQPKMGRSDNRGTAVVVLDALTRRQWVREEDLAKDLKLHSKQLRRTLRFFEEEKLVTRDHRKETAKNAKMHSAAVALRSDGQHGGKEGEEKIKLHTHSYCCLDYAQIYDVVRYRLHRMNTKLKDELEQKNTVQEYICPNCAKRYTAFDAGMLVINSEGGFRCENCEGELVESDKAAAQEVGDGDDNARKRRREKLKEMLKKLEEQVKPLVDQISRIKDLPVPEFGTLQAWEARANAARRANGDSANDPSKSSQGGYSGTPMPFLGDTKVEVAFSGAEGKGGDVKSDTAATGLKVLPPWMIKQGMNLTKEQRGEVKEEDSKMDVKPVVEYSGDKKSVVEDDDKKNIQDEYAKAYYAALLAQQQKRTEESASALPELPNTDISNDVSRVSPTRQVGMKCKREDEDDVEWEDAPVAGNVTGEGYKINDLNVQADASGGEEEEDDIWEED